MLVLLLYLKSQKLQPVCDKCLVKMEALNLCMADIKRKHDLINDKVRYQKALSLDKDFSQRPHEMSTHSYIAFMTVYCYNFPIVSYCSSFPMPIL